MEPKIRISRADTDDPRVDQSLARLDEEMKLRAGMQARPTTTQKESLIHKSWFYLGIAGMIGALIAWGAIVEPNINDAELVESGNTAIGFLSFAAVGGLVGLFIGCTEGVFARNAVRAVKGGLVGLAIGAAGGLISNLAANFLFNILLVLGVQLVGQDAVEQMGSGQPMPFLLFLVIMIARSLGWGIAGMTVGLGPGIAVKSKKMVLNGFLGGMLGGLIGGLLFDPVSYLASHGTMEGEAYLSRAVGMCAVGLGAGLLIGWVEMLTKDAWLLMTAGPLTGKQFIVYNNPTLIGSSAKCEIYLFRDPAVEQVHAAIHRMRDAYEIEDRGSGSGTFVNGERIARQRLVNGDQISIGRTTFSYSEKAKRKAGKAS